AAIVPVRSGSKGLVGKNLKPLAGIPLWERAVAHGLDAGAGVLVTTDSAEVLKQGKRDRVAFLDRPVELAADDAPMGPVILHALEQIEGPARIVLLQPTSPLRAREDVEDSIALHATGRFDLVKTVTATDAGILKYGTMDDGQFIPVSDPAYCFTNRQDLPPVMKPNGAVYVFDRDWFLANGGFATDRIGGVVMPAERSFDIDTEADFLRAEALIKG
ncbi:MAG: acylneuraminate cytidylyltransferase family protein, partial [Silicimonas sp.]|nr:acylneuraminate cytidylyltransferase family protein [Silicimonas sp.]